MAEVSSESLSKLPDELTTEIKKERDSLFDNIKTALTGLQGERPDKLDIEVIEDCNRMIEELSKL